MPDIGLLQGAPPRRRAPHPAGSARAVQSAAADSQEPGPVHAARAAVAGGAVAARFGAPSEMAIVVTETATPDAPPTAASAVPDDATSAALPPSRPVSPAPGTPAPIRARDLWWLALALFIFIGTGIGARDPWPADEPRFAVVARDMVATGEWLFPRVGGDLYQDKPPLFFWLLASCFALIGSIKWSFLIPAFVAAGGTLFLIYDLGRRLVSREAGLAAALITVSTAQFVMTLRGAQIDPVLCFLTTFSLYAFLRHLLLGPAWGWYLLGGALAGLGVITKGVGFLPLLVLVPFFLMRGFGWRGLAPLDGGRFGWRWWLAVDGLLIAICLWFVPMLIAVSVSGAPEYAAYRDEILFKQTVGRYAAAWHHVKPWYYFLVEVIPVLWLPWSLLLIWLVPKFRRSFAARDARVWLPLGWALIVLVFFSLSPGKRGVYILPALPALAIASLPWIAELLARPGVRRAGWGLAIAFWIIAVAFVVSHALGARFAIEAIAAADLRGPGAVYAYLLLCSAGLALAWWRAPLLAWPAAFGSLAVVFSYLIAPAMNGERSGKDFVHSMLARVAASEELGLVAYKEQFLLYLDRPTVNFGHRRWLEGAQETYDAAAWVNAGDKRVLLVPEDALQPCFDAHKTLVGRTSRENWYLVRGMASTACAEKGDVTRAIRYAYRPG
jgi:4-amino-4-deoxy-L-arabinose transferase-like glycosyltransferase